MSVGLRGSSKLQLAKSIKLRNLTTLYRGGLLTQTNAGGKPEKEGRGRI
uniref:Uncharacterized protein n=1 Tax=Arundo donax TaxID=35708 RepID=A0A0A8ZS68_ARUDO